jgi:long-chain acyl-CoA synthetase
MDSDGAANPFLNLERNARDAPNATFLKTSGQTITNSDALRNVKQIAYELRRLGVTSGQTVALDLPEVLTLMFVEAIFHEAAISTALPVGYDPDGTFAVDWFFTNREDAKTPTGSESVLVDGRFLRRVQQNPFGIRPLTYNSGDDIVWVVFSSGTTGRPNAIPVYVGTMNDYELSSHEPWVERGDVISFLPAKTPLGLFLFANCVMKGIPFLAIGDNIPADSVRLVANSGVRTFVMSPAQVAAFVGELEKTGRTLPQVEVVFTVGSAMSPELNARMRAATEGCEIFSVYASTEAGVAAIRPYESDDPFDLGQVRHLGEVEVVDDDNVTVPLGDVGRIRYRSPFRTRIYLGDPESTAEFWNGDWFYPGDLGSLRPNGGLTFAGRASEIINAGGLKVNPVRLDQFATSHAGVLDAAAFGFETADGILQVGIALVTVDGYDVQALVAEYETEFGPATPQLVARVSEIPRNSMGKPLRRELAEKYRSK